MRGLIQTHFVLRTSDLRSVKTLAMNPAEKQRASSPSNWKLQILSLPMWLCRSPRPYSTSDQQEVICEASRNAASESQNEIFMLQYIKIHCVLPKS